MFDSMSAPRIFFCLCTKLLFCLKHNKFNSIKQFIWMSTKLWKELSALRFLPAINYQTLNELQISFASLWIILQQIIINRLRNWWEVEGATPKQLMNRQLMDISTRRHVRSSNLQRLNFIGFHSISSRELYYFTVIINGRLRRPSKRN